MSFWQSEFFRTAVLGLVGLMLTIARRTQWVVFEGPQDTDDDPSNESDSRDEIADQFHDVALSRMPFSPSIT